MVTALHVTGSRGDRERARRFLADALGAVRSVPGAQAAGLLAAARSVLDQLAWEAPADGRPSVAIAVEAWPDSARVTVDDRAAQMTADEALASPWHAAAARLVDVAHPAAIAPGAIRYTLTSWTPLPREVAEAEPASAPAGAEIDLRPFRDGDETPIAALLRTAYGLIAPLRTSSYYPRRLRHRVRSGELRPHLAVAGEHLVGHVGLHRKPGPAGWRTGTTAVAPAARGRHVADRLKDASLATLPDDATDVLALTIGVHPWTQRVHLRLGLHETAIELGAVSETRSAAYGIPQERWSRQSHVRFHHPLRPRRRPRRLPEVYAALLEDAYERLGIDDGGTSGGGSGSGGGSTRARGRSVPRRSADPIRLDHDPADASATITVDAVPDDWRERCRRVVGAAYALPVGVIFARVALDAPDPIDPVVALLNAHGFFYAGLRIGDDPRDRDFLGLQARAIPAQGEHRLELASDAARSLHVAILADEARCG